MQKQTQRPTPSQEPRETGRRTNGLSWERGRGTPTRVPEVRHGRYPPGQTAAGLQRGRRQPGPTPRANKPEFLSLMTDDRAGTRQASPPPPRFSHPSRSPRRHVFLSERDPCLEASGKGRVPSVVHRVTRAAAARADRSRFPPCRRGKLRERERGRGRTRERGPRNTQCQAPFRKRPASISFAVA